MLKKKKGKTNNNMIKSDLWDEARGDTIQGKKKVRLIKREL